MRGEVAEWLKAAVSKIAILCTQYRGFESHPLRHFYQDIQGRRAELLEILRIEFSKRGKWR
jgi:hypothetical protein